MLALGDAQYVRGTPDQFLDSYDPSWGRFRDITYPVPGIMSTARRGHGYYDYFGPAAGDRRQGWYSFDLHRAGAELVLNGHDHNYERFAPQDPAGQPDAQRGIRQFVVGTGGKAGHGFGLPVANSETRNSGTRGVLRLELHPEGYDWRFAPGRDGLRRCGVGPMPLSPRRYDRTAGLIVDDARLRPGRRRPPMDRRGVEEGR